MQYLEVQGVPLKFPPYICECQNVKNMAESQSCPPPKKKCKCQIVKYGKVAEWQHKIISKSDCPKYDRVPEKPPYFFDIKLKSVFSLPLAKQIQDKGFGYSLWVL